MKGNEIEQDWERIMDFFKQNFTDGQTPTLDTILYLIGVQELGKGFLNFSKDDKINLMHLATCKLLEPFGYYEKTHVDPEGWPHYKQKKSLSFSNDKDKERFFKKIIVDYFKKEGLI